MRRKWYQGGEKKDRYILLRHTLTHARIAHAHTALGMKSLRPVSKGDSSTEMQSCYFQRISTDIQEPPPNHCHRGPRLADRKRIEKRQQSTCVCLRVASVCRYTGTSRRCRGCFSQPFALQEANRRALARQTIEGHAEVLSQKYSLADMRSRMRFRARRSTTR